MQMKLILASKSLETSDSPTRKVFANNASIHVAGAEGTAGDYKGC